MRRIGRPYFYRAWPLDEDERFPILFMALDAVFGDQEKVTQSIINGVIHRIQVPKRAAILTLFCQRYVAALATLNKLYVR